MEHYDSDGEELKPRRKKQLTEAELIKIAKEKQDTLNRLSSRIFESARDKVAYILNNSYESRNSDIDLVWEYWNTFEDEYFNEGNLTKENLRKLTRYTSMTRERRRIQNDYRLFEANDDVKKLRGVLEDEYRQTAIDDRPSGIGSYTVYIDETGKTQDYLSVGSLWVLEKESLGSHRKITEWKRNSEIDFEFHFSKLTRERLQTYKDFFSLFLGLYPAIGFKIIVINNKGLKDKNGAITDLTYHLLSRGIQHEHDSRRAPLPRNLQVWIDQDEAGSDHLKLANIRERLKNQNTNGLLLDSFEVVSSQDNLFIQIIDLFTGAINRKLHSPDGNQIKDEFADFVLQSLNFDMNNIQDDDKNNENADNSTVFNLR
ncbi:DUF3800 domain-containing protein [Runella sp.]|uniref:DUF3800 domain-containing protein n=1 Tax=Runella sp. TaxID=1960881 RepID=UPI003D11F4BF